MHAVAQLLELYLICQIISSLSVFRLSMSYVHAAIAAARNGSRRHQTTGSQLQGRWQSRLITLPWHLHSRSLPPRQILESVIKFRWGALPVEQREGIKNYVSNLIIKYATNEQLFR